MSTGAILDTIIVDNNQAYPSTVYTSADLEAGYYTELLKTANAYDSLFGLNSTAAATATASSGTADPGKQAAWSAPTADLRVAAPAGSGVGATDSQPMVVTASDPAAQRIIDQAQHSLIREWIVRPDVRLPGPTAVSAGQCICARACVTVTPPRSTFFLTCLGWLRCCYCARPHAPPWLLPGRVG